MTDDEIRDRLLALYRQGLDDGMRMVLVALTEQVAEITTELQKVAAMLELPNHAHSVRVEPTLTIVPDRPDAS